MKKKEFFIKLILWLFFAAAVPIMAIVDKYDMIKNGTLKYTGWGILVFIIAFIFISVICGYIAKIFKWSMALQIFNGVRLVLVPLLFMLIGVDLIVSNIANVKYILVVAFISEAIAIPLNPFPKWLYMKNISDLREALK
jgi:hypothetical protein